MNLTMSNTRRAILISLLFTSVIMASVYRYRYYDYATVMTPPTWFLFEDHLNNDLRNLSATISAQIWKRQNPENCDEAQLLVYDIKWWPCGFGCTVHVTLQHFLMAFYANRTFVLKSNGWAYDQKGWNHVLMPLGKCDFNGEIDSLPAFSNETKDTTIVSSPNKELYQKYDWKIPKNVLAKLTKNNHRDPYAWWIGQFINYMVRLQPWFTKEMTKKWRTVPITNFTVGLQIRWGDKVGSEAIKHPVSEYMDLASKWFKRQDHRSVEKTVYVATEQSEAWRDLEDNYHDFSFIGAGYVDESKELDYQKGYNYAERKNELEAMLTDIYFLSKSSFVVCTFSSNICRLLYEIKATHTTEPQTALKSLDEKFYWFTGPPKFQAIKDHVATNKEDIDLTTLDIFQASWDSFSRESNDRVLGTNTRTGQEGRVPRSKLEVMVEPLNFDL